MALAIWIVAACLVVAVCISTGVVGWYGRNSGGAAAWQQPVVNGHVGANTMWWNGSQGWKPGPRRRRLEKTMPKTNGCVCERCKEPITAFGHLSMPRLGQSWSIFLCAQCWAGLKEAVDAYVTSLVHVLRR